MRAAHYTDAGGPEVIDYIELPDPTPGAGEVVIAVSAAGLNRADVMQRQGMYPPPAGAPNTPGLEVSGRVVSAGDGADQTLVGTEVVALLAGGGYAERVAVDAAHVLPLPQGVDAVEAAGLMEVAATVHSNLHTEAHVTADDVVVVHGGTGGIGTFALQYLSALGATTITTVGNQQKAELAQHLGAQHVINYRDEDFAERVREITDGRGADTVLDVVGAKYLDANLRSLALDGRMIVIGLQGGRKAELDLGRMLSKRLRIIATTLRSRDAEAKAKIVRGVHEDIWPLVAEGRIRVPIDRTFSFTEAQAAHEYFDSGEHTGKVLLTM